MSVSNALRIAGIGAAAVFGGGLAVVGWATGIERRRFVLRELDAQVLPPGSPPLRVLHLADFHLAPGQRKKQRFVQRLASLEPDLVVMTGDNFGHRDALPHLAEMLEPFRGIPGVSVFGSNDYFGPVWKSPLTYLMPPKEPPPRLPDLDTDGLRDLLFNELDWVDLTDTAAVIEAGGVRIRALGVDDPHIDLDHVRQALRDYDRLDAHDGDLVLGLVHAPYQRVLDVFAKRVGVDAIFAGHTHGGQVCLPGGQAIVSNCDLPPEHAGGLSHWRDSVLHVSRGLGTSIYAPVRTFCPPEATLLTLTARNAI